MNEIKSLYHIDNQYLSSPVDFGDFSLVQLEKRHSQGVPFRFG